jgi:hypothetical protein
VIRSKKRHFIPAVIWFGLIMFLLCLPGNDVPEEPWFSRYSLDKVVHAGLFGILTFLICFGVVKLPLSEIRKRHYYVRLALCVSIWGLVTEFIQLFYIPHRDFELLDWAADSVGAFIALYWCIKYLDRFNNKLEQQIRRVKNIKKAGT